MSMKQGLILQRGHRSHSNEIGALGPESHGVLRTHRLSTWLPRWGFAVCTWSKPRC